MLSRVDVNLQAPQALCICPTRELAIQNVMVGKERPTFDPYLYVYLIDNCLSCLSTCVCVCVRACV